ncbi:MAG: efflux RND transporter permease subunit [Phycisphaeraceae bacterium]|nr:efflux RND transporter permease subunit [Phycisphaerales bacterium]MCB9860401.1 efflux RND transporter permease subunit [Phycisphaeraceae bacterium]
MTRFFAGHPTAANLLMLIMLAIGIMSLPKLQRETFPKFTPSEIEVRVVYPGATAQEVDQTVCQRVIDALDGVESIDEVRSDARDGVGIVTVKLIEGGNIQTLRNDVEQEVSAINDFPDTVEDPVIIQLGTTDRVLAILVSGPLPAPGLKAFCEGLKDRLQALDEVSLVRIEGFSDHQLRVELSPIELRRYGLSVWDVADRIDRQSVDTPAGDIEADDQQFVVRLTEERRTSQQLEDLVIAANQGAGEVRLGDLGRVLDTFENAEDRIEMNGVRAGLLWIEKTDAEDTIRVARAVRNFLDAERARYPMMHFAVTQDISVLVSDRLRLLITNGWQGMVLVFLAMWLFFAFRLSLWVALGLPVSFLGAMYFLAPLDLTINMMTMVGLLLALGLLMDDAIVVTENIASHRAQGKKPVQAAIDGIQEVLPGVIASFLTTVCVLGPLAYISGDIGKVLRVVPIILILVLSVSLIEALLILPAHLAHSMHRYDPTKPGRMRRRIDAGIDWVRERWIGRPLSAMIRYRYLVVGIVVGAFLLSAGLVAGGIVKFQPFPNLEGDVLETRILLPQGTPLARTEEIVQRVQSALDRVNHTFANQPKERDLIKQSFVRYNVNTEAFENGPHVATITVDLLSAEERSTRMDDVIAAWREEIGAVPDVISMTIQEPALGPAGRAIELRFVGDDLPELKAAAQQTKAWFDRFVGVSNTSDDLRPGRPEFRLRIRPGTFGLQLDAATMARQLRAMYQGQTAAQVQVNGESMDVDVVLAPSARDSLADFDETTLRLPDGSQVPLDAVASIERARGWARIARFDNQLAVTLRGDIDERRANTSEIMRLLKKELLPELSTAHPGVRVDFEGEAAEGAQTQRSMMLSMVTGIFGIFVILSFQFRSYSEPLIVMAAIPFSLIGVVWGHLLMGVDLSLPSMLGFISLAGVVVNDSILLVMFLKDRRSVGGNDIEQAACQASKARFRAVMLTSLTTIAGLLPLMSERSLQAQVLIPIAISIVFGLLASTLLVLLVLPCLYVVLEDLGLTAHAHSKTED